MATRTTLNVSLPVELGRFVESLVHRGHYASSSEVVRSALRLLMERELGRDKAELPNHGEAEANEGKAYGRDGPTADTDC